MAERERHTLACEAMATRFAPRAQATHVETSPCRKKGADSCTYAVSW